LIPLLDFGITILEGYLTHLGNKVPAQLVASIQSAIDAIAAHRDDLITKQNLEAQRG